MRTVFRIAFSRYGIVTMILVVIVLALALAQTRDNPPLSGNGSSGSSDETAGSEATEQLTADDGVFIYDCDEEDCYAPDELPEAAVDRAVAFAEAWVNPNGLGQDGWYQSIAPYLTEDNAEIMREVPPESVPARRIDGDVEAGADRVVIPMDTGTLTLRMIEGSNGWTGRDWLVASIDWEAP